MIQMILDVSSANAFGVHGDNLVLNARYSRLVLLHDDGFELAVAVGWNLDLHDEYIVTRSISPGDVFFMPRSQQGVNNQLLEVLTEGVEPDARSHASKYAVQTQSALGPDSGDCRYADL